jgi:hypothetical protein
VQRDIPSELIGGDDVDQGLRGSEAFGVAHRAMGCLGGGEQAR